MYRKAPWPAALYSLNQANQEDAPDPDPELPNQCRRPGLGPRGLDSTGRYGRAIFTLKTPAKRQGSGEGRPIYMYPGDAKAFCLSNLGFKPRGQARAPSTTGLNTALEAGGPCQTPLPHLSAVTCRTA